MFDGRDLANIQMGTGEIKELGLGYFPIREARRGVVIGCTPILPAPRLHIASYVCLGRRTFSQEKAHSEGAGGSRNSLMRVAEGLS